MLFAIFDRKQCCGLISLVKGKLCRLRQRRLREWLAGSQREISDAWEPIRLIKEEEIEDGLSWHYNAESIGEE